MGKLLPFHSKGMPATDVPHNPLPQSPEVLFKQYYGRTCQVLKHLVTFYQNTGYWTEAQETPMVKVVTDLRAICASLAGVNDNGTPNVG